MPVPVPVNVLYTVCYFTVQLPSGCSNEEPECRSAASVIFVYFKWCLFSIL